MRKQVSAWLPLVTALVGALSGFGVASFNAGRQLAILDELRPALEQVRLHSRKLDVVAASCCPQVKDVVAEAQETTASIAVGLFK